MNGGEVYYAVPREFQGNTLTMFVPFNKTSDCPLQSISSRTKKLNKNLLGVEHNEIRITLKFFISTNIMGSITFNRLIFN